MGVLDIDYDNLIVKKETVMGRVVFTLDNFYKYPKLVAAHYHKYKNKSRPPINTHYPGKRIDFGKIFQTQTRDDHINDLKELLVSHGFDDRFVNLPDHHIDRDVATFSIFDKKISQIKTISPGKLTTNTDAANNEKRMNPLSYWKDESMDESGLLSTLYNPHTDANPTDNMFNKLACLCYLSGDEDIHGGTALYYNKAVETGTTGKDYNNKLHHMVWKKYTEAADLSEKERKQIVIECLNNTSKMMFTPRCEADGMLNDTDEHFQLVHLFRMRWNRLIVYEGDILHAMYIKDIDFVNSHERLTTNYFLAYEWAEPTTDEYNLKPGELKQIQDIICRSFAVE
jgi:hypothetical protein